MDIKELDKRQLILITLLITFVVSIATGIVTVSLMQQMPESVPQTINNVIQRTIEKVTTVEAPKISNTTIDSTKDSNLLGNSGDVVVSIYSKEESTTVNPIILPAQSTTVPPVVDNTNTTVTSGPKELGQGIIISDIGLIMVDSTILNDSKVYKIILNKTDFDATILKKFTNGFTILKISTKKAIEITPVESPKTTQTL